ncbi:MauE/DoxX family redox-associated membrane protein, partial [Microbispora bryophytorum]|uniref:MauE/DoxX family redox-associated membrane protein n=1 Tax=Microbispora bryophytorum TaxID=1460882 RepID=UPI00361EA792
TARAGLLLAGGLLLGFAAVLVTALRRGTTAACRCFGASDEPVNRRHVARNAVLAACAVAGAAATSAAGGAPVAPPAAALCLVGASVAVGAVVLLDDLLHLLR